MAGAGYKLFQTGDVLTAAQVNTYLNEQTVMVFADAAARTTALTSVLAEGMMSYLQDTNAVEVYNGTAWVGVSGAGDVTEVQAGTGISVASGTGPIPVVTNTMATAIDAEGDLIIGDAADAFQRLAIGSNTHVLTVDTSVDGKIKWAAPGTPALVGVSLEKSNATTSLTSNVTSYLTYTTENWDTNTFHDNSTNTTRITIPSGYGGKYLISGYIGFGGVGSDVFEISLRKNGGNAFPGGQFLLMPNNAANTAAGSFATVLNLVATDYLELGMRTTNTNANYAVNSLFQATYLGA
jgi:hypothetical protein